MSFLQFHIVHTKGEPYSYHPMKAVSQIFQNRLHPTPPPSLFFFACIMAYARIKIFQWSCGGFIRSINRQNFSILIFFFYKNKYYFVQYIEELKNGKDKIRIFLPMCGKAGDLMWLYRQGHTVVGAEGVPFVVDQFFR